jgi:hypothetical protein
MSGLGVIIVLILIFVVAPLPVYLIGSKRRVPNAWVAFIPVVGSSIVWLWSMDRSGWMMLIELIPLVNVVFAIWLCFSLPPHHDRTRWWGLALLLLPWLGMLLYALTLEPLPEATHATAF